MDCSDLPPRNTAMSFGRYPDKMREHNLKPMKRPKSAAATFAALPALRMNFDLGELIESPRFKAAAKVFGVTDVQTLVPPATREKKAKGRSSKKEDEAVEASLYARMEKRRLLDLSGVLSQREKKIKEVEEEARQKEKPKAKESIKFEENRAAEHARRLAAAAKQNERWIDKAAARSRKEIVEMVETHTTRETLIALAAKNAKEADEKRMQDMVNMDAKRRASHAQLKADREARHEKKLVLEKAEIEHTRQKLQHKFTLSRERLDAGKKIAAIEYKRRVEMEELAKQDREHERQLAAQLIEAEVARKWEKHQARAREAEEKAKLVAAGVSVEGCERLGRKPAANRIAEATARRVALEAATIAEYEAKDRETKMRMQVHEQMRSFATAFRVEANKEKAKEAEERKQVVQMANESFKQLTVGRLAKENARVDALHERRESKIRRDLQLAIARDEEKRACAKRAQNARDYELKTIQDEQDAMIARVEATKAKTDVMGSASRKKIEELKFAREELKDTLIRSPDSSIVVLRKHPELIAAIGGTEFVDRVEDRKKSLASSLSAPHLSRPATTGGSPSKAIKPLEGFEPEPGAASSGEQAALA